MAGCKSKHDCLLPSLQVHEACVLPGDVMLMTPFSSKLVLNECFYFLVVTISLRWALSQINPHLKTDNFQSILNIYIYSELIEN